MPRNINLCPIYDTGGDPHYPVVTPGPANSYTDRFKVLECAVNLVVVTIILNHP
jgi:hypothetical protein